MAERPHGYARYKLDGCRCYTCGWARAQYEENRQRAIAYGTWQPHVPAAPVREHIVQLQQCGMGLRAIAAAAGNFRSTADRQTRSEVLTAMATCLALGALQPGGVTWSGRHWCTAPHADCPHIALTTPGRAR